MLLEGASSTRRVESGRGTAALQDVARWPGPVEKCASFWTAPAPWNTRRHCLAARFDDYSTGPVFWRFGTAENLTEARMKFRCCNGWPKQKRQGTAAVQDARRLPGPMEMHASFWTAPAFWSFVRVNCHDNSFEVWSSAFRRSSGRVNAELRTKCHTTTGAR